MNTHNKGLSLIQKLVHVIRTVIFIFNIFMKDYKRITSKILYWSGVSIIGYYSCVFHPLALACFLIFISVNLDALKSVK